MIGLLFFGVIGLWIAFAIWLGLKLPQWFKWKWSAFASALLIPLILFAPVIDEVIAYPQMQALCAKGGYELAMDEKSAQGRTIYNYSNLEPVQFWPSVEAQRLHVSYADATTHEPVIEGYGFIRASNGFLGIPAGSSGNKMTLLLGTCASKRVESIGPNQIPSQFKSLNLIIIDKP
jgi:hypothetical protein